MANTQFDWWRAALAGNVGPISDGEPHSGYYRNRNIPHVYWKDDVGNQFCQINGKDLDMRNNEQRDRALTAWPFAAKEPVAFDYYKKWKATGTWPDQSETVTETLVNQTLDPESKEGIKQQISALANEADRLIKLGAAKDKPAADRAADIAVRLSELHAKAEKKRKSESDPFYEKYKAIIEEWRPTVETAEIYKRMKSAIIQPFLDAENRRIQREHQEALAKQREAQEAQRKLEEEQAAKIEEANAALDRGEVPPEVQPMQEAPAMAFEPIAPPTPVKVGSRGRGVSARSVTTAVIEDYAKALEHLKDHEDIKAVVQELATKFAKIGTAIPGCRIDKGSAAV